MLGDVIICFREKFYQFMQGRYGVDQFSRFLTIAGIILMIISRFLVDLFRYTRLFNGNLRLFSNVFKEY